MSAKSHRTIDTDSEHRKKARRIDSEWTSHKSTGTVQQRGALATHASATIKEVDGVKAVVDPMLAQSELYEVVVADGVAMAAFLNQVDAATNANKYYRLELLSRDDGNFYVWSRWGRNGDAHRYSNALKLCASEQEALKLFHSTFRSKTACAWVDRLNAKPGRKGKYAFVQQTVVEPAPVAPAAITTTEATATNTTVSKVDKLIKYVIDGAARKAELDALGVDVSAGLHRLAPAQLVTAHGVLESISALLSTAVEGAAPTPPSEATVAEIRRLSDQFYCLVPTKTGRSVPPPIDTAEALAAKLDVLEALAAPPAPVDDTGDGGTAAFLAATKLNIKPLSTDSDQFAALSRAVSESAVHDYDLVLKEAFALSDGPAACLEGSSRRLLFHGTRRCNLAGVLSNGLKLSITICCQYLESDSPIFKINTYRV